MCVIIEISPSQKFVPMFSSAAKTKTMKKITTSK